ncbi:MAG: ribonuclease P protein component [Acidobacteriaceae bacterium]
MSIAHNSHRLAKHADYQQVYKAGRKQFGKQIGYFYLLRTDQQGSAGIGPRIGLTVPKALGKAVDRNRIKRRMREAVRSALPRLTAAVDVVLHPRRVVIDLDFVQLRQEVATLFSSIQAACERAERREGQAGREASARHAASACVCVAPGAISHNRERAVNRSLSS